MSVAAGGLLPQRRAGPARFWRQFGLALAAILLVGGLGALLFWLLPAPSPPPRNPFGVGVREAAPAATGIGGWILSIQGSFYKSLQTGLAALKQGGTAVWSLVMLGFAYGVFHAAGPGHGKAVIAAYLVSNERAALKGFGLSLAAALLQAVVAIALVGTLGIVLGATATVMSRVTNWVEIASFAAVAAIGLRLLWRKAGKLVDMADLARGADGAATGASCDHVHLPPPAELDRLTGWRDMVGVVLAAGLRPCSGALIVLVLALAQGFFAAGIAATVAMAIGTAVTTGAIALLAVSAKALALRIAGGRGAFGSLAIAAVELLAAAFVLVFGLSLLVGFWTGSAPS